MVVFWHILKEIHEISVLPSKSDEGGHHAQDHLPGDRHVVVQTDGGPPRRHCRHGDDRL